ncbi:hypothetical protein ON010_g6625 [Phytophthora cinnamomi]|nr:hypothetical protein ON010_g6625 [Phytophthora cinnamomi]
MTSSWKAPAADDEDGGGAASISDVFADMLNVNEDMIAAAAECQAEQDVEGLVASTNTNTNSDSNSSGAGKATASVSTKKSSVADLTAEPDEADTYAVTAEKPGQVKKTSKKKTQRGALRTAIEAGEKVREIQRSKEQWIKSRHQVLEEEGVSAIMNDNSNGMLEVAAEKSGENTAQPGCGGVALANQLRAHQHIAAFVKGSSQGPTTGPAPAPMNLLVASQLAIPTAAPPLVVSAPLPTPPQLPATGDQPIKPNSAGNNMAKIALPPANAMFNLNVFFPFPGAPPLMFNPPGLMPMPPWPQMQASVPARPTMSVRSQATMVMLDSKNTRVQADVRIVPEAAL